METKYYEVVKGYLYVAINQIAAKRITIEKTNTGLVLESKEENVLNVDFKSPFSELMHENKAWKYNKIKQSIKEGTEIDSHTFWDKHKEHQDFTLKLQGLSVS